jgi:hypothetical protein
MGQDGTVVIVSSKTPSEHELREQKPPLQDRVVQGTHFCASRFFPWNNDNAIKLQDVSKAQYVPWLGLLALAASGLTVLFSSIVLMHFNHKVQDEDSHFKPASWLSIILSGNSVLLHVALSGASTVKLRLTSYTDKPPQRG